MRRDAPRRPTGLALLAAAAAAIFVAGCGEEESDQPRVSGPAALTPADVPLYAEAVVRPEGDRREAIESFASRVSGEGDPGGRIVEEIDESLAEDTEGEVEVTYEQDIEPWLGERAGIFVSDVEALGLDGVGPGLEATSSAAGAAAAPARRLVQSGGGEERSEDPMVILESTDDGAAQEFIDKGAAADPDVEEEEAEHRGVDYLVDEDGTAVGLVGGFLVIGTEQQFRAAVDASRGGDSLEGLDDYSAALEDLGGDPVASLYLDVPALVDAAGESGTLDPGERAALSLLDSAVGEEPFVAVATVEPQSATIRFSLGPAGDGGGSAPSLVRSLPADSWAAVGLGEIGEGLGELLATLERAGATGLDAATVEERFRAVTGVRLSEALAAFGDAALFGRGSGLLSAGGGLVVEVRDRAVVGKLIEGLRRVLAAEGETEVGRLEVRGADEGFSVRLPGAPSSVHVALGGDRLAIAYGASSARLALRPQEGLEDAPGFSEAAAALGEEVPVSLYLDFGPLGDLLAGAGALGGLDAGGQDVREGLERLDFLAFGMADADGRRIGAMALGAAGE